jgi:hypothetical protein
MNAKQLLLQFCSGSMLMVLASCSGTSGSPLPSAAPADYRVSLKVYDESFLGETPGSSFIVVTEGRGSYVDARVSVDSVSNLRALCLELQYDPALLTPVSVERSRQLDKTLPATGLLQLVKLDRPGTVHYAHMEAAAEQGFSGKGNLLTVRFVPRSMAATRLASAPPSAEHSRVELNGSVFSGKLEWYYRNRGDYDQNGEVNVADITPLGINLGTDNVVPGTSFDESSVLWMVDGDENGSINISDITPLGSNLGNSASSGYNIYASDDEADYPDSDNGLANGTGSSLIASMAGTPPLSDADNFALKATEHLHFSFELPDPLPGAYYWVRPAQGSSEGIPSNLIGPLSIENIPKPQIDALDKTEVVIGETITITGSGFGIKDEGDSVMLNELPLEITSWTNTTIKGKIPEGAADGPLVVSTQRSSDPSAALNVIPPSPTLPDGNTV